VPDGPRSRRGLLVGAAALVGVIALVWIVAFSPVLGVRTVAVRGAQLLTAGQVRTAAGVGHGTPLLRVDTGAIARRVERLPEIKSATVTTSYPSTVTISVVERVPVGFVDVGQGHFVLVDAGGAQFRTVAARPARLPLLVVPNGAPTASSVAALAAVASVAGTLPATLLSGLQSIQALDASAITLVLTDGRVVSWGSAQRSADKARVLPALLRQPGTHFDVSNPDLVVSR
jgi:cell division protein FtsQ